MQAHKRSRYHFVLVLAVLLFAQSSAFGQAIVRVDAELGVPYPPGFGNGWQDNAYEFLSDAIDRANLMINQGLATSVQIWVALGEYFPDESAALPNGSGSPSATFLLRSNVAIYGGFRGHEPAGDPGMAARDPENNITLLNGDLDENDVLGNFAVNRGENVRHVVVGDQVGPSARLDGFRIKGGRAIGAPPLEDFGGGLLLLRGSAGIVRCIFYDNMADNGGAAHTEGDPATPGPGQGGPGNTPNFVNCAFFGNYANVNGGAFCNRQAELTMANCLFSGNSAMAIGAMIISPPPTGGTTFTTRLINCTFSRNAATNPGSTGGVRAHSDTRLDNCILWNNTSGGVPSQFVINSGTLTLQHCNVQGNGASGTNIDADPMFADDNGGDNIAGTLDDDLRLVCFSPSIDTASSALLPPDFFNLNLNASTTEPLPVDLDMLSRQANAPDMGSYERQLECCPTDVNGDLTVNVTDLLAVIGGWASPCVDCTADIAPGDCGDGNVNVTDLLAIIGTWGGCPQNCGGSGLAGSMPQSVQDCMNKCSNAGLTGEDWNKCVNACIEWLCQQQLIDCD